MFTTLFQRGPLTARPSEPHVYDLARDICVVMCFLIDFLDHVLLILFRGCGFPVFNAHSHFVPMPFLKIACQSFIINIPCFERFLDDVDLFVLHSIQRPMVLIDSYIHPCPSSTLQIASVPNCNCTNPVIVP